MVSLKYFLKKVKDVKITDIKAIFPMMATLFVVPFYKNKYRNTWLICEEPKEARDNGYWFFRKMCENHPEQHCIYAIDKLSVDYAKVKSLGEVIQYGSLRHWIVYFTCRHNISSQKGGKPNAALCSFIELNGFYNAHNIFLQHGVTKDNVDWLQAKCFKTDMFVTAAVPEKNYIEDNFGYQRGVIKLTGFPRFDNLHNIVTVKNQIVIMPTWRQWFKLKSKKVEEMNDDFITSDYLEKWSEFLNYDELNLLIEKYQLKIIFYPHRNMQNYLPDFRKSINSNIIIASWEDYDLQELLKTSEMLITDYSSVFFDMIYMKKPIIFYQFDIDQYRKYQYEEGYFRYDSNPFGKSCKRIDELLNELRRVIDNNYSCKDTFLKAHSEYFKFYDMQNSERIFNEIIKIRVEQD